jgi:hypothetical protein
MQNRRRPHRTRMPAAPARQPRARAVAVGLSGLALLAAGCGSSPHTGSASQSPPDLVTAAFKYASCMRDHGATNFPDPQVTPGPAGQTAIRQVVSPARLPHFKAAQKACAAIMPGQSNANPTQHAAQQHAREQDLLAFAKCLRSHGVTNFPDPTSQGRLTLEMVNAAGVDLHAPVVLTAAKACLGAARGAITGADVERAVNGKQ